MIFSNTRAKRRALPAILAKWQIISATNTQNPQKERSLVISVPHQLSSGHIFKGK
jgi:hypothetical protein